MMKLKYFLFVAVVFLVGISGSQCLADLWTGIPLIDTLTVGATEIVAGSTWNVAGTSFTYEVTRPGGDVGPLHYKYTLTLPSDVKYALSHLSIEVSDGTADLPAFDPTNPMDYVNGGPVEAYRAPTEGDKGFPTSGYSFWSIKFEDGFADDVTSWTVEFDSKRLPIEGSFFAKGGKGSFAYNTYLTGDDDYIAVPDTSYIHAPVPGAVILGVLGLGVAGWRLRKFA